MSFVARLRAAFFLFVVLYSDFPTRGNGSTSVANENVFPVEEKKTARFRSLFCRILQGSLKNKVDFELRILIPMYTWQMDSRRWYISDFHLVNYTVATCHKLWNELVSSV